MMHTPSVTNSEKPERAGAKVWAIVSGALIALLVAIGYAFVPPAGSLSPFGDESANEEVELTLEPVRDRDSSAIIDLRYRVASPNKLTGPLRLFANLDAPISGEGVANLPEGKPILTVIIKAGGQTLAEAETVVSLPDPKTGLRFSDGNSTWLPGSGDPPQAPDDRTIEETLQRYGLIVGSAGPESVAEGIVTLTLAKDSKQPLTVNMYVREAGTDQWKTRTPVAPGATVEMLIRAENQSMETLNDLVIACNLADYMRYVADSTIIINGNHPDGVAGVTDNVTTGGIDIGDYNRFAVGYVQFSVKVSDIEVFEKVGKYTLRSVGIARAGGSNEIYNVGTIDVIVPNASN